MAEALLFGGPFVPLWRGGNSSPVCHFSGLSSAKWEKTEFFEEQAGEKEGGCCFNDENALSSLNVVITFGQKFTVLLKPHLV